MRAAGDRARGRSLLDAFLDLVRWPLWLYFRLFYGLRVRGLEHLPRSGPVVLSPNHQTHYDGILVGMMLRRPMYSLVSGAFYRKPVIGWLLRTFRGIPVHGGRRNREAFAGIVERLAEGHLVAIFPEGHRTADGELLRLKTGAARAALTVGAPIVPASILGGFEVWPRQRTLPRLCRPLVVEYHPPIRCEQASAEDFRRRVGEVTAELAAVLRRRLEAWRRLQGWRARRRR